MNMQAMKFRALSLSALVLLFTGRPWASADEAPPMQALEHNPFVTPAFIAAPARTIDVAREDWSVRGVLISEKGTSVNINGSILRLHEFIEGYELTALDGEKAVLSKNGQKLVLAFPNTSGAAGANGQKSAQSNE